MADKRIEHNGDLPAKIDVVSRRSTDGDAHGANMLTVAAHDETGGCGDPASCSGSEIGRYPRIFSHGKRPVAGDSGAYISAARIMNNGLTWGPMLDINPQIFTTDPSGNSR